jgi:serine/threonine protein kinase
MCETTEIGRTRLLESECDLIGTGTALGSYELISLLGEGTTGRVFLARHQLLGRRVALKMLRTTRDDRRASRAFSWKRAQ